MIAENAGRGGATLCLPLIMQAMKKRKEAGKDASGASGCDVLVLAGDHETGGFALACARILGSYGVPVKTFVATDAEPCEVRFTRSSAKIFF
jgi:NAD(P)H-hydrate repair Nnr-like enzyme with NAD(P)H-hydrate epimerase domain